VIGFWWWERLARTAWRHQIETRRYTAVSAFAPVRRQSTMIRIMVPHSEAQLSGEVVGKIVFSA
jgi:hypothetical protein